MHRRAFDAADTMALALIFVVADQAAHGGKRVVLKQHPPRLIEFIVFEQADDFRDVGVDGTALLAAWFFAAQAEIRLVHNVQRHTILPLSARFHQKTSP